MGGFKFFMKALTPQPLRQRLLHLWRENITEWRQVHYSLYGEDVVISHMIDVFLGGKSDGFFVDVGAFHPSNCSNTYLLYKHRGWRGINIEPNPDSYQLFLRRRARDINLNMGVANSEGQREYYVFDNALLNTFSSEYAEKALKDGLRLRELRRVTVEPLTDILENWLPDGQSIDFLNVDVESMDLEVLQSLDWNKYRPRIIAVEDLKFRPTKPEPSAIYTFLKELSYVLFSVCSITLIFLDLHAIVRLAETWLVSRITELTGVEADEVDVSVGFAQLGLSSVAVAELTKEIEDRLGGPLEPCAGWEHLTIREFARHVVLVYFG